MFVGVILTLENRTVVSSNIVSERQNLPKFIPEEKWKEFKRGKNWSYYTNRNTLSHCSTIFIKSIIFGRGGGTRVSQCFLSRCCGFVKKGMKLSNCMTNAFFYLWSWSTSEAYIPTLFYVRRLRYRCRLLFYHQYMNFCPIIAVFLLHTTYCATLFLKKKLTEKWEQFVAGEVVDDGILWVLFYQIMCTT